MGRWLVDLWTKKYAQACECARSFSHRLTATLAHRLAHSLTHSPTHSLARWWLLVDFWTGSNGILDSFSNPKPGIAENTTDVQSVLAQTVLLVSDPLPLALQAGDTVSVGIVASAYADVPVRGLAPITDCLQRRPGVNDA